MHRVYPGGDKVPATSTTGGALMSIVVRYLSAPSVTREMYDEVNRRLETFESSPPDGLIAHVAFAAPDGFRVSEVWESAEQFQAWGERLLPILTDVGVELAGEPEIHEIYNLVVR
jgi:hypothetical protein